MMNSSLYKFARLSATFQNESEIAQQSPLHDNGFSPQILRSIVKGIHFLVNRLDTKIWRRFAPGLGEARVRSGFFSGLFVIFISLGLSLCFFTTARAQAQVVVHKLTTQTLQNPEADHLEKLRALEIMAREYEGADSEARAALPDLYKTAYEALVLRQVDSVLELAYTCKGLGATVAPDKVLALDIVSPHLVNPKARALKEFLLERSVPVAKSMLDEADTPLSKAVAYMALADAYFAENNVPKAILFSTLSLAQSHSEAREAQTKYYLTGRTNADLSLRGSKEEVLARLNEKMEGVYNPHTFQRYFSMATVLGLLPSYPLVREETDPSDPIHLCMAFDDPFAMHGVVTMLSAVLSSNPDSQYIFHVLEDIDNPLKEGYKERICDLVNEIDGKRFEVAFESMDKSVLPDTLQPNSAFQHWPRLVLFKLYIPEIFSDLDRILWLDADLIVRRDLHALYDIPMKGKWFAGVRDYSGDKAPSYLPLPERATYLNLGVLLYDIAAINQGGGCDLIDAYCLNSTDFKARLKYPEQDMLAVIFPDSILELEHQTSVHLPDGTIQIPHWNWYYVKGEETHWKRVHNHSSSIIHMAGRGIRPWRRKWSPTLWSWIPKRNDGVENMYWVLRDMGPWPVTVVQGRG